MKSSLFWGPHNEFPLAACFEIAALRNLDAMPALTTITGGTGLGKTRLLREFESLVGASHPGIEIRLFSAEQIFASYKGLGPVELIKFRHGSLVTPDILLIDDLQWFVKDRLIEEDLVKIFDERTRNFRPIMLAGDLTPEDFEKMFPPLKSRIHGGLMCEINPPNQWERSEYLRLKQAHYPRKYDDSILTFIAENTDSIRQLEGALLKIQTYEAVTGQCMTLELAKEVLKHLKREGN